MEWGPLLKAKREAMHLTQQELSTALGVSLSMVTKWEAGAHRPKRDTAQAIDDTLSAGGELFTAFGYTLTQPGPVEALQALVREQTLQLAELTRRVGDLDAEVARLKRRGRPDAAGSR